jgi:serine/threonine protein phosphatase PrpC
MPTACSAYGLLVADGIGGGAAGEMASRLALTTLVSLILHTPDWIMSDDALDVDRVIQRLADHYRRIHAALLDEGLGFGEPAGFWRDWSGVSSLMSQGLAVRLGSAAGSAS